MKTFDFISESPEVVDDGNDDEESCKACGSDYASDSIVLREYVSE